MIKAILAPCCTALHAQMYNVFIAGHNMFVSLSHENMKYWPGYWNRMSALCLLHSILSGFLGHAPQLQITSMNFDASWLVGWMLHVFLIRAHKRESTALLLPNAGAPKQKCFCKKDFVHRHACVSGTSISLNTSEQ